MIIMPVRVHTLFGPVYLGPQDLLTSTYGACQLLMRTLLSTPLIPMLLVMFIAPHALRAQHDEVVATVDQPRHEVSLLLAHTFVSEGLNAEGKLTVLGLPSWGLNYNFWLSPHWAVGLHTDIISEVFVVKENLDHGDGEPEVERSFPVAPALMTTYRPHEHWAFMLGAGAEFAKEGNLFLMRAGTEYTIHLSGAWETSGSLAYDFRTNAYDSWTLGFGVTRTFK
jgi:hypothetical protein